MSILNFGKYKGQEVSEIVDTDQGRQYLQWLIDQPVNPGQWEAANLKRNKEIGEILAMTQEVPKETKETLSVDTILLQVIVDLLERIESNQRKFLSSKGVAWDE